MREARGDSLRVRTFMCLFCSGGKHESNTSDRALTKFKSCELQSSQFESSNHSNFSFVDRKYHLRERAIRQKHGKNIAASIHVHTKKEKVSSLKRQKETNFHQATH